MTCRASSSSSSSTIAFAGPWNLFCLQEGYFLGREGLLRCEGAGLRLLAVLRLCSSLLAVYENLREGQEYDLPVRVTGCGAMVYLACRALGVYHWQG